MAKHGVQNPSLVPEHILRDTTMKSSKWKNREKVRQSLPQRNEMTVWRQCGKSHIYSGNRIWIHALNCVKAVECGKICLTQRGKWGRCEVQVTCLYSHGQCVADLRITLGFLPFTGYICCPILISVQISQRRRIYSCSIKLIVFWWI